MRIEKIGGVLRQAAREEELDWEEVLSQLVLTYENPENKQDYRGMALPITPRPSLKDKRRVNYNAIPVAGKVSRLGPSIVWASNTSKIVLEK